jgi:hypothetical protein
MLVLAGTLGAMEPDVLPLGHPDFYPTPERPVGWRGDGNGAFPGATCVDSWNVDTGQNVAWRVNPPGAGFSQPIVVGEKVFVTCDPNILACYHVHTGDLLWQTALDHTTLMPADMQKAARAEMAFFAGKWREYHAWCEAWDDLAEALVDAKLDPKALSTSPDQNRQLRKPEPGKDTDAILAVASLRQQWETLYSQQETNSWARNLTGYGHRDLITKGALWKRWQEASRLYDFWWFDVWEGATTANFATPISDGQRVYVTMQNNNVAAVNLDGSIAWHIWDHLGDAEGKRNTLNARGVRYVASPVLYKDFLFVYQDHHARCYDAKTGKKLWEHVGPYGRWGHVNHHGTFSEMFKDGVPPFVAVERTRGEGTSPILVQIPLGGGGTMPAVHDGINILYRLEDGKVLTKELPFGTSSSPNAAGNVLMRASLETYMVRLTATDRDTVALDFLYRTPKGEKPWVTGGYFGDYSKILHDGWWYPAFQSIAGPKGPGAYRQSTVDGRIERYGAGMRSDTYCSPILVGNRVYVFDGGDSGRLFGQVPVGKVRPSPGGGGGARYLDLGTGKVRDIPKAVRDTRLFEDPDYAVANRHTTDGTFLSNSSPLAQANRIFFRTKGVLYCFGDPTQPFPAPKDCPPAARVQASTHRWCLGPEVIPQSTDDAQVVAAIRAATGVDGVAKYLESDRALYRYEALKKVSAFAKATADKSGVSVQVSGSRDPQGGTAATPSAVGVEHGPPMALETRGIIENLAKTDPYEQIRAEAYRALGMAVGQPGAVLLQEQLLTSQGGHGGPAVALRDLQTIHHLGAETVDPVLVAMAGNPDGKTKVRAAEIVGLGRSRSLALRDALLPLAADRSSEQASRSYGIAVTQALSDWPADAKITDLMLKIVNDDKDWGFHPPAVSYLLRSLPEDQKNAMLQAACKAWNGAGNVATLLERGAVADIKTLVSKTKDRIQAGIIHSLCSMSVANDKPEQRKFAADMGVLALQNRTTDLHALGGIVNAIKSLGADAAPVLPVLKGLKIEDAATAKTVADAIAEIETKVKGGGK